MFPFFHISILQGLINDVVFGKCKPTVRVINVARGGIIDEASLLRALNDGKCAGVGLDVFETEPPTNRLDTGLKQVMSICQTCFIVVCRDLLEHHLAVVTPHLGASTVEAQMKVAQEIANSFVNAKRGEPLQGRVIIYLTSFLL